MTAPLASPADPVVAPAASLAEAEPRRARTGIVHNITCFIDVGQPAVVKVVNGTRPFLSVELGPDITLHVEPGQDDAALVAWLEAATDAARMALGVVGGRAAE